MIETPMVDNHCTLRKTNYADQNDNSIDGIDIADSKTKQNDISNDNNIIVPTKVGEIPVITLSATLHAGLNFLLKALWLCTYNEHICAAWYIHFHILHIPVVLISYELLLG